MVDRRAPAVNLAAALQHSAMQMAVWHDPRKIPTTGSFPQLVAVTTLDFCQLVREVTIIERFCHTSPRFTVCVSGRHIRTALYDLLPHPRGKKKGMMQQ